MLNTNMITLNLTVRQAEGLLEALDYAIEDVQESYRSICATADATGDDTGLLSCQETRDLLLSLYTELTRQLGQQRAEMEGHNERQPDTVP